MKKTTFLLALLILVSCKEGSAENAQSDKQISTGESIQDKIIDQDNPLHLSKKDAQKLNAQKYREEQEKYGHLPDCEGAIDVQLGPHIVQLPRSSGISLTKINGNGSSYDGLNRPSLEADCERTYFDDVSSVRMLGWVVDLPVRSIRISYSPDGDHFYGDALQRILKYQEKFKYKKTLIDNNIILYRSQNGEGNLRYYIFPIENSLNPLKPMVISCHSTWDMACYASYVLPNSLSLNYYLQDGENQFLLDKKFVDDKIMSLISNQQQGEK